MPAPRSPETFGERVAILRTARGLDQIQLGELVTARLVEAGDRDPERPTIGRNRIGAWENDRAAPSLATRRALAAALGVPLHLLLGDYPFEVPPRGDAPGHDPETFGERLALTRTSRQLSQGDLGELLPEVLAAGDRGPVQTCTISTWENDHHRPALDTIAALCRALHTSADILLGLVPFRVPPLVVGALVEGSCTGPAGEGYSLGASA